MKVSYGPAAVKAEVSQILHCIEICGKDGLPVKPESEDLPSVPAIH